MDLATLFGNLQEYEMILKILAKNEEGCKNRKSLALKVTDVKDMESEDKDCKSESDEDIYLIF